MGARGLTERGTNRVDQDAGAGVGWANGDADIGDVMALVSANPREPHESGDALDDMYRQQLNDDSPPLNMDGWDGIQYLYTVGRLSDEQFHTLYEATKV